MKYKRYKDHFHHSTLKWNFLNFITFIYIISISLSASISYSQYKTTASYSMGTSSSNREEQYSASNSTKYSFALSYCTDSTLLCTGLGFGAGSISGQTIETTDSESETSLQYFTHRISYRNLFSYIEIYPFVKARQRGAVPLDLVFLGNFSLNSYTSKDARAQSIENTDSKYTNLGVIPSFEYGVGLEGSMFSNFVYQFSVNSTKQTFLVNEESKLITTQSIGLSLGWMPASGKTFRKK
jgi:hypothetical protein